MARKCVCVCFCNNLLLSFSVDSLVGRPGGAINVLVAVLIAVAVVIAVECL